MGYRKNIYSVILAGGEGTRFAPFSTPEKPKQFLSILHHSQSLLQQTYERIQNLVSRERILVSTNKRYTELVQNQLPDLCENQVIGEPQKKNTAPAIGLLTRLIHVKDPGSVVLFFPADHFIADPVRALGIFEKAHQLALRENVLVAFGVPPSFPSADYGYICRDDISSERGAYRVRCFVEKPDILTAEKYLAVGNYYWNSGIFAWRTDVLLATMDKHLPVMASLLKTIVADSTGRVDYQWLCHFFEEVEGISIDYGVMEKADNVMVLPFDVGWSDLGTWKGLAELATRYQLELPEEVKNYLSRNI